MSWVGQSSPGSGKKTLAHLASCSSKQTGHYHGEQMYGVIWEGKRQNGSCPVARGRSEERKDEEEAEMDHGDV